MLGLKECMESVGLGSGSTIWMGSTLKDTLVLFFFLLFEAASNDLSFSSKTEEASVEGWGGGITVAANQKIRSNGEFLC